MRKYDAVFIFQTGDENLAAAREQVSGELTKAEIKVVEEQDLGERDLAYEIRKANRGHYVRYEVEATPESIQPVQKALKLRPEILKFVFFRKEQ